MRFLLDTQLLLWSTMEPHRLSRTANELIANPGHDFLFSSASLWEIAIKFKKFPDTFRADPRVLLGELEEIGYQELFVTSLHGAATAQLPLLHKDPFDRILVAQSVSEGVVLATADPQILRYDAATLFVG